MTRRMCGCQVNIQIENQKRGESGGVRVSESEGEQKGGCQVNIQIETQKKGESGGVWVSKSEGEQKGGCASVR